MALHVMPAESNNQISQVSSLVYIADNDVDVSNSIGFLLATEGIHADVFVTGASLMDAVFAREPDCIVLATCLPDMTGVVLLKKLRELALEVPVIILADTSDIASAVDAVKSGAWDYFEKPFIQHVLLDSVRRAIF